MNDVKRLFSFLTALVVLAANMAAVTVFADESDIEDWMMFPNGAESGIEIIESDEGSFPEVLPDENDNEEASDPESQDGEQSEETENAETGGEGSSGEDEQREPEVTFPSENSDVPIEFNGYDPDPEPQANTYNEGTGDIEGLVDKRVFQVSLPVKNGTLDYVADPQGLICGTESAKHPDTYYDPDSNVYFDNGKKVSESGETVIQYSDVSDPITVVNKSSCAVEVVARVSLKFNQEAENPVLISPDRNWTNIVKPSICLSVIKSDDLSEVVLSKKEKIITASIPGCPSVYHYVYEDDGSGSVEYNYKMMTDDEIAQFRADPANADIDTSFKEFSLCLTGECNSQGEWDHEIDYDFPSTSIVWNVGLAASVKPYISQLEYSVAYDAPIEIPYSLGAFDTAAKKIVTSQYVASNGSTMQLSGSDPYMTITEDTITLSAEFVAFAKERDGGTLRFRFDDPAGTEIDVKLDRDLAPSLDERECYISADKSTQISIGYDLGTGNKAAREITSISYGSFDFTSSAYASVYDDEIVLKSGAVRMVQMKNGGKIYITFDDPAHTRCGYKINIEK